MNFIFISVESESAIKYLGDLLRVIYGCYIAEISDEFGAFMFWEVVLGDLTIVYEVLFKYVIVIL